jgi:hypothetical protein
MNWSFLDILDEITFSKPVQDRFKRHFRTLAHPSAFSRAWILGSSEVKRLGAHALRVRPALQQNAMPGRI